jgi:hypothetical protein
MNWRYRLACLLVLTACSRGAAVEVAELDPEAVQACAVPAAAYGADEVVQAMWSTEGDVAAWRGDSLKPANADTEVAVCWLDKAAGFVGVPGAPFGTTNEPYTRLVVTVSGSYFAAGTSESRPLNDVP